MSRRTPAEFWDWPRRPPGVLLAYCARVSHHVDGDTFDAPFVDLGGGCRRPVCPCGAGP